MTDKLKNDLLKSNIQCIGEYDGKFVFLLDEPSVQNSFLLLMTLMHLKLLL